MAFRGDIAIPDWKKEGFPEKTQFLTFHWGVTQSPKAWEKHPSGTSQTHDFAIVRELDKWSPLIFTACVKGTQIPQIIVYLSKVEGNTPITFVTYWFNGCYINSVRPGGNLPESDNPLEEVSINFDNMKYEFKK